MLLPAESSLHTLCTLGLMVTLSTIAKGQKKKPPRIHLLVNGGIKYDILMQQNITQPREERQCVPEAKYLVRQDGVGATVGMKL